MDGDWGGLFLAIVFGIAVVAVSYLVRKWVKTLVRNWLKKPEK